MNEETMNIAWRDTLYERSVPLHIRKKEKGRQKEYRIGRIRVEKISRGEFAL